MTVGRRRLFLALSFFSLAAILTSGLVRAQAPNQSVQAPRQKGGSSPHEVWGANLTPDQLKAALARLGQGDGNPEMSQFQEMLKDYLSKQNDPKLDPNNPLVQEAIKNLVGDKGLMDRLKAMAKQKQGEPGGPSKFSQDDIAKLLKSKLPDGFNPPTGPTPNTQPPNIPPPNNPNFPNAPPELKFPPNPKQGGNPNGQGNPMPIPPGFPNPIDPGNPLNAGKGNPLLPDNNPFGQPDEPTDPRTKSMAAIASLWERNVGPLDETPEVKRALFDLASGENGFDFDMKDDKGNSIWDFLKNGSGDNSAVSDTLNGDGGDWKMPKFDLPTIGWSKWFGNSPSPSNPESSSSSFKPRPDSLPSSGSGGFGGFDGFGGLNGFWWSVVLGVIVLGSLFLWWWYLKDPNTAKDGFVGNNIGPWPVDPRAINTREDVVKAFEYLSVLICGPAAKMWTHGTIAEALTDLAISHGETAVKLARLYELARYAPLDEGLTRHELIEARHLICDLAGVS
jgi:hypothetical protein